MTTPIPVPLNFKEKPINPADVRRFRALLAFQLRAMLLKHEDIARILNLRSKNHSRSMVAKGRRVMISGVIETVLP